MTHAFPVLHKGPLAWTSAGLCSMFIGWQALPPRGLDRPSAIVAEGEFRETMVETGTLTTSRVALYASELAGTQAKILEIVPEGTAVEAGDVLVRFDAAPFEAALARERAALAQAEAELTRAHEDLRLEQLRADDEIAAAEQQVASAAGQAASEAHGRGPLAIIEAEAALAEARRHAARARTHAADVEALLAKGFVTRIEVERAADEAATALERERLASLRLDTLREYDRPASIERARAELDLARQAVGRSRQGIAARVAQRRAALSLAEHRVSEQRVKADAAAQQVARTVIGAEGSGLVVYREIYFGSDRRKPQVGDEVWPNQPLLALPDSSQFIVETRVREVDLHRIVRSQRVDVRLDAFPDLVLPASVSLVGSVAQEDASRPGTRFFAVTVTVTGADPRLRSGMTARVEIEVARAERARLVPSDAIVERDGKPGCLVWRHGDYVWEPVTVVGDTGTMAGLSAGPAAGDRVARVDRLLDEGDTPP